MVSHAKGLEKVYKDVKANEPGTKLYQIGVDPKDKDTIWLWEEVSDLSIALLSEMVC